jgi:hypothetical protein
MLPIASLNPPEIRRNGILEKVFDEDDHLVKVLVSDCRGHGRALESLQEVLQDNDIKNSNVDELMNRLYDQLRNQYWETLKIPAMEAYAIARAVLTRTLLESAETVPGTNKQPYQLTQPGLIRYDRPGDGTRGYFTAPYIWVWMMSHQPDKSINPLLRDWRFCDYGDHRSRLDQKVTTRISILATL